jgi:hypothetical protein
MALKLPSGVQVAEEGAHTMHCSLAKVSIEHSAESSFEIEEVGKHGSWTDLQGPYGDDPVDQFWMSQGFNHPPPLPSAIPSDPS